MKTIRLLLSISFFAILIFSGAHCKKDAGMSRLTVYLTDAPVDYDAVNIEVVGIQVKANTDPGEGGWQTMPMAISPVTYNVLEFTNGMEALLSTFELPAGKISQLRLILGDNNSIVVNGVTEPLPLEVPSGEESGLKFNIHADLIAGIDYKLWIDFDAKGSIVDNGAGSYILKPLIRTFNEATSGAIKGIVLPIDANATLEATNGFGILNAVPDPVTGEFLIRGVPSGVWTVTIHGNNGYLDQVKNNIAVAVGQVTDMGTITLTQ
ncbi:MAG TPA: DUF4382 domain-containing protein [Chitinophagaceae bacterium]|nr:DUF4382 domain-containing protein [Chitinophagaceae bacterium]